MEKYNDDKYYYKVSEIAGALKEYLKEGYRILYEMLSLIDIKSDVPYNVEIKIHQGSAVNLFREHIIYEDGLYDGKILLFISKSRFSPARMFRNYKTRYMEDEDPLYSVDNADFIIEKENGSFTFKKRYNHDISRTYKPKLSIIDIDRFAKLYQRLEEEGYLTYPSILYFSRGNPEFSFVLSSQRISLQQSQDQYSNRYLIIEYAPSKDLLYVKDNRKNPELTPEQMFDLKIPKEDIYKGYASIIDKNLKNERIPNLLTDSNNEGNLKSDYKNDKPMVLKKTRF